MHKTLADNKDIEGPVLATTYHDTLNKGLFDRYCISKIFALRISKILILSTL